MHLQFFASWQMQPVVDGTALDGGASEVETCQFVNLWP